MANLINFVFNRVNKTVDSDSKEAKDVQKQEDTKKTNANPAVKPVGSVG